MSDYCIKERHDPTKDHDFKLFEGVTVSVGFDDILDHTLRENLPHFDRFVVVTDFHDHKTQQVCAKYSIECVCTDAHRERGQLFNKGMAINLGLAYLRRSGWVVHLDADIALPDRFRNLVHKTHLDPAAIYGADRFNVVGRDRWHKHKHHQHPQYHSRFLVDTPEDLPIGATLVHKEYGYAPIGYFQMFSGTLDRIYPAAQRTGEHTDVLFALKWPRDKRHLLPTVRVFHLEPEKSPMGANWKGRKTKRF